MNRSIEEPISILLADDSHIVREILCEILEEKYSISFASHGEVALQKYRNLDPDIIILDLHMPSIGGLEVIDFLRKDFQDQNVYILVVTGETSSQLKNEALNKGANDYLMKPYNSEELLARVGVAERQIKLQKQLRQAFSEIEKEIELLGDIQSRLLPKKSLEVMDVDIQSYFKPSGRASGDFFDYFTVGDSIIRALVADVSGHGARAAFLMGVVRSMIRMSQKSYLDLSSLVEIMNEYLANVVGLEYDFVTLFIADLDLNRQKLEYINAGHCPALFKTQDSNILTLEPTTHVMGVSDRMHTSSSTLDLSPEWKLFVYTDGIYEWKLSSGQFMDQEIFLDLAKDIFVNSNSFIKNLLYSLESMTPNKEFRDDVTALLLQKDLKR